MSYTDTIAFVTGANRGIGEALVLALLEAGAPRVYATARSEAGLARWTGIDRVVPVQLDIRDAQACVRAASRASDVDLLVNNAGTLASYDLLEAPAEALETDFGTNFYGLLHMARAFAPTLRAKDGAAMINLLTLVSVANMPAIGGYSASKAAAWSLTQALRAQLAADGVRVHGVFPGAVDTDMIRGFDMPKTDASEVAAAILAGVADGTEDIAPDPMARQLWSLFEHDPKAVERQFAAM